MPKKALVLVYVLYYTFYSTKMKGTTNKKDILQVKSTKQKILLPTLKEQHRYVVYRVIVENVPKNLYGTNFTSVHNNIVSQCNAMLGIFDGGKAGLIGAKYNADVMAGIIRVNTKYVDKLKVCLGMIKEINNRKVNVDCIYVSGMLNKAADKISGKISSNADGNVSGKTGDITRSKIRGENILAK